MDAVVIGSTVAVIGAALAAGYIGCRVSRRLTERAARRRDA